MYLYPQQLLGRIYVTCPVYYLKLRTTACILLPSALLKREGTRFSRFLLSSLLMALYAFKEADTKKYEWKKKEKKTRQIREKIWSDDICKCSSQGVGIYVFLMFMTNFMHFITYPLTIYYSSETIFVQTLVSSWWFLDDIMKAAGHLRL